MLKLSQLIGMLPHAEYFWFTWQKAEHLFHHFPPLSASFTLLIFSFPAKVVWGNWHSYYLLALFRTPLCLVLSLGCDIFPFSSLQIYRRHWLLSRPLYKYISSQLLQPPASSDPRLCVSSSHGSRCCRSGTQTCNGKPVINLCYHLAVAAHVWRFRSPDLWAWWLLKNTKTKANSLFSPDLCVCVCGF